MAEPLQPVAIVGLGGVFPGAASVGELWDNVCAGVDAIGDVPPDRWDPVFYESADGHRDGHRDGRHDRHPPRIDRIYCRRGGFVDDVARFDPVAFGVVPVAVEGGEPDQFLALAQAAAALDDSGQAHRHVAPDRVGVIVGRGGYRSPGLARLDQRVHVAQQLVEGLRALLPDLDEARLAQVRDEFVEQLGEDRPEAAIGLVPNLAASRIANRFDLRGPAYTVDAACASSLVAVDHAVRDLATRRCDLVVAGGSHHCHDVTLWSVFSQLGALSRHQRIRPFSRAADGLLIGEGTGFVVLKRLQDAERDGDRVYAVIRGSGVASDGRARSLLHPDPAGQVRAMAQAWRSAGLDPATAGLVEAHGTGTPAGDAAELEALRRIFGPAPGGSPGSGGAGAAGAAGGPGSDGRRAGLGSIKSMIGHAMPAAGVAGLIKATLAVHHGVLPPTLHADDPHPLVARTRFRLLHEAEPWASDGPRRVGVSAFGFGGVNGHLVLEQHGAGGRRHGPVAARTPGTVAPTPRPPVATPDAGGGGSDRRPPVLRVAAPDVAALADHLDRTLTARDDPASPPPRPSIADVVGDPEGPARLAVVDVTPRRLALARKVVAHGTPWRGRAGVWFEPRGLLTSGGRLAFLFPGVDGTTVTAGDPTSGTSGGTSGGTGGGPHGGTGAGTAFDTGLGELARALGLGDPTPGRAEVDPPGERRPGPEPSDLERSCRAIVSTGRRLHRVLAALGVHPDLVAGHSLGEWSAQVAAGMVPEEAVDDLVARLRPGEIELGDVVYLAIGCDAGQADGLVAGLDHTVVSHGNCPHQSVVCGPPAEVAAVAERCRAGRLLARELPFRSGFHSPLYAAHLPALGRALGALPLERPKVPVWSATTARPYPSDPDGIRELAVRHLVEPVRFDRLVDALHDAGARVFVQMGVGSLTAFVDDTLRGRDAVAVPALRPARPALAQLHHLAAALWVEGCPVALDRLAAPTGVAAQAGRDGGAEVAEPADESGPAAGRQTGRRGRPDRGSAARSGRPALLRLGTRLVRDLTPLDASALLPPPSPATRAGDDHARHPAGAAAAGRSPDPGGPEPHDRVTGSTAPTTPAEPATPTQPATSADPAPPTGAAAPTEPAVPFGPALGPAGPDGAGDGRPPVRLNGHRHVVAELTTTLTAAAEAARAVIEAAAGASHGSPTGTAPPDDGHATLPDSRSPGDRGARNLSPGEPAATPSAPAPGDTPTTPPAGTGDDTGLSGTSAVPDAPATGHGDATTRPLGGPAPPGAPATPDATTANHPRPPVAPDTTTPDHPHDLAAPDTTGPNHPDIPAAPDTTARPPGATACGDTTGPDHPDIPAASDTTGPDHPDIPAAPDTTARPPGATAGQDATTPAIVAGSGRGPARDPAAAGSDPALPEGATPRPARAPESPVRPPTRPGKATARPGRGLAGPDRHRHPRRPGDGTGPDTVVLHRRLALDVEPAWADHAFFRQPEGWPHVEDRFPLVPMAGIVEMVREAAGELHPDLVPIAVEDVSAYRWLRVAPPTEVTLRATTLSSPAGRSPHTGAAGGAGGAGGPGGGGGGGGLTGGGAAAAGAVRVQVSVEGHARATVVLAPAYPDAPPAPQVRLRDERPGHLDASRFYVDRHTFHGPAYQGIRSIDAVGDDGVRGVVESLPAPGGLLDNASQLVACWLSATTDVDRLVLPTSIRRVEMFGPPPPPGARVACVALVTHADERVVRGDLLVSAGGSLWCRATGWEDRRFATDDLVFATLQWPERNGMSVERHGCTLVDERWPDTATRDIVMRRYLGRDERRVYQRHHPRAQRRFLLGRIAAKDAVRRWLWARGYGDLFPAEVVVVEDAVGRPVVRGPFPHDLRVSVAHVDGLGVARVAEGTDVGVDVEQVDPRRADFEELVLTPGEQRLRPPDGYGRDAWLTCLWAVKVAAARAAGRRDLGGRPRDFEVVERRGTAVRVGDRRIAFARLPRTALRSGAHDDKEHIVAWTLTDR